MLAKQKECHTTNFTYFSAVDMSPEKYVIHNDLNQGREKKEISYISEYDIWKSHLIVDTSDREIPLFRDQRYCDPMSLDSSDSVKSDDTCGSDDSGDNKYHVRNIISYKKLSLSPSYFINGCVCGHDFEFRDAIYNSRKQKNIRSYGITISTKVAPVKIKLRQIK